MSSLITPLMEKNRSNIALTFFIFSIILSLLSFRGGVPDLSSVEATIGLLLVTVLITATLSTLGLVTVIKKWLSGLDFKESNWIGKDQKRLLKSPVFHRVLENHASNLFFGCGITVISFFIAFYYNDLIQMLFGDEYMIEDIFTFIIFFIIVSFSFICGIIIIYQSVRRVKRKENEKYCWNVILLTRLRNIPRSRQQNENIKKFIEDFLESLRSFIMNDDFTTMQDEIMALLLNEAEETLIGYYKSISDISKAYNDSNVDNHAWGYPEYNLNIKSIIDNPELNHNFLSVYISNPLGKILAYPKLDQLNLFELLFASNSKILITAKEVERLSMKLQAIDCLYFRYTWYFIHLLDKARDNLLPMLSGIKLPKMTNKSRMTDELTVVYSVFFSSFLLSNGGFDPEEVKPIVISYKKDQYSEGKSKKIHITRENLRNFNPYRKRMILSLSENSMSEPFEYKESIKTSIEKEIQFLRDNVREKREWLLKYGLNFDALADLIEYGSFDSIFEFLKGERTETVALLMKEVEEIAEIFDKAVPKTPWCNDKMWNAKKFVFQDNK